MVVGIVILEYIVVGSQIVTVVVWGWPGPSVIVTPAPGTVEIEVSVMVSVCPGTVVTDVSVIVSGGRVTGGVAEQVLPPGTVTEIVSVSVDAGGAVVGQVPSPGTVMDTVSVSVAGGGGLAEHVSSPGTVITTVSGGRVTGGKVTGGCSGHSV